MKEAHHLSLDSWNHDSQTPDYEDCNQEKDEGNRKNPLKTFSFKKVDNRIEQVIEQTRNNDWQHDSSCKLKNRNKNKGDFTQDQEVQTQEQGN